jgi:hypothetical protein
MGAILIRKHEMGCIYRRNENYVVWGYEDASIELGGLGESFIAACASRVFGGEAMTAYRKYESTKWDAYIEE